MRANTVNITNVSIYSDPVAASDFLYNSSSNTPTTNAFKNLPFLTNYTIEMTAQQFHLHLEQVH